MALRCRWDSFDVMLLMWHDLTLDFSMRNLIRETKIGTYSSGYRRRPANYPRVTAG